MHRRVELHNLGVVPLTELSEVTYDLIPDGDEASGDPFAAFGETRYATTSPLLTEVPFEISCGSGRVRGRIDAVYPTPDAGWEIVDFKSGRDRPDGANLVQLQTYALAAAQAGIGLALLPCYLGDPAEGATPLEVFDFFANNASHGAANKTKIHTGYN